MSRELKGWLIFVGACMCLAAAKVVSPSTQLDNFGDKIYSVASELCPEMKRVQHSTVKIEYSDEKGIKNMFVAFTINTPLSFDQMRSLTVRSVTAIKKSLSHNPHTPKFFKGVSIDELRLVVKIHANDPKTGLAYFPFVATSTYENEGLEYDKGKVEFICYEPTIDGKPHATYFRERFSATEQLYLHDKKYSEYLE